MKSRSALSGISDLTGSGFFANHSWLGQQKPMAQIATCDDASFGARPKQLLASGTGMNDKEISDILIKNFTHCLARFTYSNLNQACIASRMSSAHFIYAVISFDLQG